MRWVSTLTTLGLGFLTAWALSGPVRARGQAPGGPASAGQLPYPMPGGGYQPGAPNPYGSPSQYGAPNGYGSSGQYGKGNGTLSPYFYRGGYGPTSYYGLQGYYGQNSFRPGGFYGLYGPYGPYMPPPIPPMPAGPRGDPVVKICDNYYEPAIVYATPGAKILFKNEGSRPHTVTGFTGRWDSGDIRPGQTFVFTVPRSLNHYFYDRHHRLQMSGSIVIQSQPQDHPRYRPVWAY